MSVEVTLRNQFSQDLSFNFISSLNQIKSEDWNALLDNNYPFLLYEFLSALEKNDCLGQQFGWFPHHLVVYDNQQNLIAASPLYIKTNSYGEFVFDWSWASAYEHARLPYYPKLVSSIPYNPVTGPRILIHPNFVEKSYLISLVIEKTIQEAEKLNVSGVHWLFNTTAENKYFEQQQLMFRLGVQYHWKNQHYETFEHFLESFISRKRKKIKQERKYVKSGSFKIQKCLGSEISEQQWQRIHQLYENTFLRKSGVPTLSLGFFREIGASIGDQILLVLVYSDHHLVACAINFFSSETLFGRFWGSIQSFKYLHFEACYYQGIEFAIENKLKTFEPGAQGEHKISRGFLPTKTWSAHWIKDQNFAPAIHEFCNQEKQMMLHEYTSLMALSPYRTD